LPRNARRRRAPIISHEQLAEIIDNACSTSFLFCLYAIVPIPELIALDLSRPVTFEKCWVATMDPINGTFFDVPANGPVTVKPEDGRFLSGGHLRWSPENICCLHTPYYHAAVTQAALKTADQCEKESGWNVSVVGAGAQRRIPPFGPGMQDGAFAKGKPHEHRHHSRQ
jgi:hypothetical protein